MINPRIAVKSETGRENIRAVKRGEEEGVNAKDK
jgi:hypothetical protein